MNPNHNNNNQYPIDYLNQIAPQQKRPGASNKLLVVVAVVGVIMAFVVGLMMALGGSGPKEDMQRLAARMQSLQTISEESQENIKSSALRGINSNLNIFLSSAHHGIAEPLSNNGLDIAKIDKTIAAEENGAELKATLEDARLNAVYDNTYAREMSFQLATITALMEQIYETTDSASMQEFLVHTDENLQPIKKQLDEFNSTD
ncbi:MAG TPA: hypothetical protein VFM68_03325 [Candidatus Saccharimonadales bacterium]|nr:hypothetical protein [Candidatus Saccharimonadales bacterium]